VLGGAAAVAGVVYLFHSPILSVSTIQVDGVANVEIGSALTSHRIGVGEPLIWTDVAGAASALAEDPWVESVSVERKWPTTVNVTVVERAPVAALGGEAVAVDGVVLPGAPLQGLPVLAMLGEPVAGRYPQQEIVGGLRFVAALRGDLAAQTTLASTPDGLVAVVAGYTVRLGRPVDMEEKARALGPVLDEGPPAGSEITLVAPARPSVLAPDSMVPETASTGDNPEPTDEG
jgi:cell division protein FtsQ